MAVTTYNFDDKANAVLDKLMTHYDAKSKSEVLRKAIALLNVASENEQADGSLVIRSKNAEDVKVIVR